MRIRLALLFVVLLVSVIGVSAQDDDPASGVIRFSGEDRPEIVAWAFEGQAEPVVQWLNAENTEVIVPAGNGCLVFLRSGYLPILVATTIEEGSDRNVNGLEWLEGPAFLGSVVDSEGLPVPATIRFEDTSSPKGSKEELCRKALAAAGFNELQASSSGHFSSPSLLSGRYALTFEAPDHATVEKTLVIGGERQEYDLGAITIQAVALVDVTLDASDIDEDPPYELVVEMNLPTEIRQYNSWWHKILKEEVHPDAPVRVETKPGTHRLTVRKADTEMAYTTLEDFLPGWQQIDLHPEPIFIEGEVIADNLPVENAKVVAMWNDIDITAKTDQDGMYGLTVWVPAHYGFWVSGPDGGTQFESLDLSEAETGETFELDFDLSMGEISGVVVAASDQSPIEGCRVGLEWRSTDLGGTRATTTANDGTFSFEGVQESDSLILHASAKGYLHKKTDVVYSGEDVKNVWVELEESASIHGRVVGPAGEPVAGIEVACCAGGMEGRFSVRSTTELNGTFEIDTLPGEILFATAQGYAVGWAVALDKETVIVLRGLSTPTRVWIQNEKGGPAPGFAISYVADSGVVFPVNLVFQHAIMNGLARATDSEGVIDVASMPPGVYQVYGKRGREMSPLGTLPIPSSGEVTFRVPADKRLADDRQRAELTTAPGSVGGAGRIR